jgi:formate transporter
VRGGGRISRLVILAGAELFTGNNLIVMAVASRKVTFTFINNLLPVTIGNIIGGSVLVGLVYWFVYLRHAR